MAAYWILLTIFALSIVGCSFELLSNKGMGSDNCEPRSTGNLSNDKAINTTTVREKNADTDVTVTTEEKE